MTNPSSSYHPRVAPKVPVAPLVILGSGGHAKSVANVALSGGYRLHAFIDSKNKPENPKQNTQTLMGAPVLGDVSELGDAQELMRFHFAIGVGDNFLREKIYLELSKTFSKLVFPALVHASAVLSAEVDLAEGCVLMPHAVVGPCSQVGRFCLLNTQCSMDHDSTLADFSSLAPGAITGGRVTVKARTAVSLGARVKQGVTLGHDSVLGANSYLDQDLPDCVIAYGTPAKVIRERKPGDPYLK